MIDLFIQCHNFQHRLTWMLSSILQQNCDISRIKIYIDSLANNGCPTTEETIKVFKPNLNITHIIHSDLNVFSKRGFVRNNDILVSNSP